MCVQLAPGGEGRRPPMGDVPDVIPGAAGNRDVSFNLSYNANIPWDQAIGYHR